jgi:hypothetical protein
MRYCGPPEATWRSFGFLMHNEFPHVERLPIHMPGKTILSLGTLQKIDSFLRHAHGYL